MQENMGMAGEFRCVVKRADGSTKIAYTAPNEEVTDLGVLLSEQRKPFEQAHGMIRDIVK